MWYALAFRQDQRTIEKDMVRFSDSSEQIKANLFLSFSSQPTTSFL
jgi:hypothetical protein